MSYFCLSPVFQLSVCLDGLPLWLIKLVKNLPAMLETWVPSLAWEDSPGEGNGYPLQYSGLENSPDCIVHGVMCLDAERVHFLNTYLFIFKLSSAVLGLPCCAWAFSG